MNHSEFMTGINSIFSQCRIGEITWKEGAYQIYLAMQNFIEENPRYRSGDYGKLLLIYETRPKVKWFQEKCEICGHYYQWDQHGFTEIDGRKLNLCKDCIAFPKEEEGGRLVRSTVGPRKLGKSQR